MDASLAMLVSLWIDTATDVQSIVSTDNLTFDSSGSGTILGAFDAGCRMVAVPNLGLQDHHQQELADELDRQGKLTAGKLGFVS